MLPEVKVYKIDYEFIINNYLDKSLWKKSWNLFVYKEHIFSLNIYQINTEDDSVAFRIKKNGYYCSEIIYYYFNNTSIKILMQQIEGAIFRCMECYERSLIKETDGYKAIQEANLLEQEHLREIASNYLDKNNVTNKGIREAYIEKYVSDNSKLDIRLTNYVDYCQYNYLTDMFITFCTTTKDETRLNKVKNNIHDTLGLNKIVNKFYAYINELEDGQYDESLEDELEAI